MPGKNELLVKLSRLYDFMDVCTPDGKPIHTKQQRQTVKDTIEYIEKTPDNATLEKPLPLKSLKGKPLHSMSIRDLLCIIDGALTEFKCEVFGVFLPEDAPSDVTEEWPDLCDIGETGVSLIITLHSFLDAIGIDEEDLGKLIHEHNEKNRRLKRHDGGKEPFPFDDFPEYDDEGNDEATEADLRAYCKYLEKAVTRYEKQIGELRQCLQDPDEE